MEEEHEELQLAVYYAGFELAEGVLCSVEVQDAQQVVQAAASGTDSLDADEWRPSGSAMRSAPTKTGIEAELQCWKSGGVLDGQKMSQLSDIVAKYKLRIGSLKELMYALLALCTGKPIPELAAHLQLPSYGSMWNAFHATSIGRREELQRMCQGRLFGIECDEAHSSGARILWCSSHCLARSASTWTRPRYFACRGGRSIVSMLVSIPTLLDPIV